MPKRFTDTELWDKPWFMALKPKLKCLVSLVRDKCDLSGVWNPNWQLASMYVGERVSESDLLTIDGGKQFAKMPGGKIFCLGFIQFQYGVLSEKSPVHRKIIGMLDNHKIDYKHPINRVQEKEEVKEEEVVMEEEKEEVKEGGGKKKINKPHNFSESEYFNKEHFISELRLCDPPYCNADPYYWYDSANDYSKSKGKKYLDWMAAIKSWIRKDIQEGKINGKSTTNDPERSIQGLGEAIKAFTSGN